MKIKTVKTTYREVQARPRPPHRRPRVRSLFWHTLVRLIIIPDLLATRLKIRRAGKMPDEPCLVLMNHSSFLDLKIAFRLLYPRRFSVVATTDAMMGKAALMRWLGCIPTQKFVTDMSLIRDIKYMLRDKKSSVLMYPEAGYSFDGTATTMPAQLGGLVKMLDVPVVTVITYGAYAQQPLYNDLHIRRVRAEAEVKTLFTREQVQTLSADELSDGLSQAFSFDQFAWQYENGVKITEKNRADGLHRLLYKCPACGAEGRTEGKGIHLTCHACGKRWVMTELGRIEGEDGVSEYPHLPDWYAWERAEVKQEIEEGRYVLDVPVDVRMLVDAKALYEIGKGRLAHDAEGFRLTDEVGEMLYEQKPRAAHTLNADFYWYEIGDVIGLGNRDGLFYCFPKAEDDRFVPVAKARLATEEMYRLAMADRRK